MVDTELFDGPAHGFAVDAPSLAPCFTCFDAKRDGSNVGSVSFPSEDRSSRSPGNRW